MRWRSAEAQATVLLYDGFAVLDRERSNVDSKLGGKRQRLVRRAVSRARFTDDRWDNPTDVCDRLDTRLDDGALGSFHGSQCVAEGHAARSTVGDRRRRAGRRRAAPRGRRADRLSASFTRGARRDGPHRRRALAAAL
jgi:hypothetical protein